MSVAPGNTPSHGGNVGHDHAPQSEGWRRKPSTCHHLAGTLAQLGRRILLVNNDPQSSLTQGLWGPSVALGVDPAETIAAVYAGEALADRIIKPSGIPGVDLVPGSVRSTRHNVPVPYEAGWDTQTCMRCPRGDPRPVQSDPDRLPAEPAPLQLGGMVESDYLIVPLQPENTGAGDRRGARLRRRRSCPAPTRAFASSATSSRWFRPGGGFTSSMRASSGTPTGMMSSRPASRSHGIRRSRRPPDADAQNKPKGAAAKAIELLAEGLLARLESRAVASGNTEAA